jgi:hypothetical protein|tara:strand:+ start:81 stop:203 length:123 start_codon:yes stop_codon:yes gene_type:complete
MAVWKETTKKDSEFKNKLIKKLIAKIEISEKGAIILYVCQ